MELPSHKRTVHAVAYGVAVFIGVFAFGVSARASTLGEREISFRNGSVELRGTFMFPRAKGPHPAVVFLHGSGPMTRAGARPYAEELAQIGVASLFFDKRGTGSSGGSWITSSLDDLAGDALAAVALLQKEESIDAGRIGLWGVSQAGWVATLAASRSKAVAFLILISGGGVSPRESELFSYARAFDAAGLDDRAKREGFGIIDSYFRYLATGKGRARLVADLEAARGSAWYPHARLDRILPSEENRASWSWVATWDPAPYTAKLTQPVLLLFGARDRQHPTDAAVRAWREGLARAHNDDLTLIVFPEAGHGIRLRGEHGAGRGRFADGYHEVMLGWLLRHVVHRD